MKTKTFSMWKRVALLLFVALLLIFSQDNVAVDVDANTFDFTLRGIVNDQGLGFGAWVSGHHIGATSFTPLGGGTSTTAIGAGMDLTVTGPGEFTFILTSAQRWAIDGNSRGVRVTIDASGNVTAQGGAFNYNATAWIPDTPPMGHVSNLPGVNNVAFISRGADLPSGHQPGFPPPSGSVLYEVTVNLNGGNAAVTGAGEYEEGEEVTINAGTRANGWQFTGWTASPSVTFIGSQASATTSFIMPASDVTLTANWEMNTAVGFIYIFTTPLDGEGEWANGFNNADGFIEFDVTVDADHTITRTWQSGTGTLHALHRDIYFLQPTSAVSPNRLPISLREIRVNGVHAFGPLISTVSTPAHTAPDSRWLVQHTMGSTNPVTTANVNSWGGAAANHADNLAAFAAANYELRTFLLPAGAFEIPPGATVEFVYRVGDGSPAQDFPVTVQDSFAGNTGAGDFAAGDNVTVHAGTRSTHNFTGWTASPSVTFVGNSQNSATATFVMPAGPVTLTANWEPIFAFSRNAAANGTISATESTSAGNLTAGTPVTVRALPNTHFRFVEWIGTGFGGVPALPNTNNPLAFNMPSGAVSLTATFERITHQLTVVSENATGVTPSGLRGEGLSVEITAGNRPGWEFTGWTSSVSTVTFNDPNSPTTTFIMPTQPVTVTANWNQIIIPAQNTAVGFIYIFTTPASGEGVWDNGFNNANGFIEFDVTVHADHVLTRTWQGGTGTLHASHRDVYFLQPTLAASPNRLPISLHEIRVNGIRRFGPLISTVSTPAHTAPDSRWLVDATMGTSPPVDIVGANANAQPNLAAANYELRTFLLPAGAFEIPPGATVEFVYRVGDGSPVQNFPVTVADSFAGNTGAGNFAVGDNVTVHAGTRSTHNFTGWTASPSVTFVGNSQNSATATFVMPAELVTLTANWSLIPPTFSFTRTAGANGTVSGTPSGNLGANANVSVTANPNTHFRFVNWTGTNFGGVPALPNTSGTLSFNMPSGTVAITANFERIMRQLNVISQGATGATASDLRGQNLSVTVTAGTRDGWTFTGWVANGISVANTSPVTFTMPANEVTLTAQWSQNVIPGDPIRSAPWPLPSNQTIVIGHRSALATATGAWVANENTNGINTYAAGATHPSPALSTATNPRFFVQVNPAIGGGTWGNGIIAMIEVRIVDGNIVIRGASHNGDWPPGTPPFSDFFTTLRNADSAAGRADQSRLIINNEGTQYGVIWGNNIPPGWQDVGAAETYLVTINERGETGSAPDVGSRFTENATVNFNAGTRGGYTFSHWTASGIAAPGSASGTFSMPANDVTLTAHWNALPMRNLIMHGTQTGGTPNGLPGQQHRQGSTVTINAGTRTDGFAFTHWTSSPPILLQNNVITTFTMPSHDIEITANWAPAFAITIEEGGNGASANPNPAPHTQTVNLNAGTRNGYTFAGWTSSPAVAFYNENNAVTTFPMPASAVTVTANWTPVVINLPPRVANTIIPISEADLRDILSNPARRARYMTGCDGGSGCSGHAPSASSPGCVGGDGCPGCPGFTDLGRTRLMIDLAEIGGGLPHITISEAFSYTGSDILFFSRAPMTIYAPQSRHFIVTGAAGSSNVFLCGQLTLDGRGTGGGVYTPGNINIGLAFDDAARAVLGGEQVTPGRFPLMNSKGITIRYCCHPTQANALHSSGGTIAIREYSQFLNSGHILWSHGWLSVTRAGGFDAPDVSNLTLSSASGVHNNIVGFVFGPDITIIAPRGNWLGEPPDILRNYMMHAGSQISIYGGSALAGGDPIPPVTSMTPSSVHFGIHDVRSLMTRFNTPIRLGELVDGSLLPSATPLTETSPSIQISGDLQPNWRLWVRAVQEGTSPLASMLVLGNGNFINQSAVVYECTCVNITTHFPITWHDLMNGNSARQMPAGRDIRVDISGQQTPLLRGDLSGQEHKAILRWESLALGATPTE